MMWRYFDTHNFKKPTNFFSFGIVPAFCKLVPSTNRHERNDAQVPAELFYYMGSYWFIQMAY